MEDPADTSDFAHVQEMLPFPCDTPRQLALPSAREREELTWLHVDILPLLTHEVDPKSKSSENQADRATPPDDRQADEVVLRLLVAPAAHAETDAQEGPVKRLRREDVLLVRVRDEGVVRRGHRDVQVPEVP